MKFSASLVLAAALGVSAYPSAHAHVKAHRSLQQRDVEFVKSVRPTRAPTNGGSNGGSDGAVGTFCNGQSGQWDFQGRDVEAQPCTPKGTTKRATAFEVGCYGNLGSYDVYGCNVKQIDAGDVNSYEHTITLENASSETQSCACFLKISEEGKLNGHYKGHELFTVQVAPGKSAYVAADDDSQGSCACGPGDSVPTAGEGAGYEKDLFVGTWVEFDFSSKKNNGWSGADASHLAAARYNLPATPMKITSPECSTVSSVDGLGGHHNAYVQGMDAVDGAGFNQPPGPFSLNVKLG